ncbi:hypothetical protein ACFL0Q_01540 [Thermodesulfobacteriota bacterium]
MREPNSNCGNSGEGVDAFDLGLSLDAELGGEAEAGTKETRQEPNLRPFPELEPSALYGVAGEFVRLATRKSEAHPAAVLSTLLARVGVEVGSGPYVPVGDTEHRAKLYVAIVGISSKSRKGTSAGPVNRLFMQNSQNSHLRKPANKSPGPLSSGEGLIYRVRDPVRNWQVDKSTGQGSWVVTDPGEEDKRLFVLDEELAAGLQCTRREGNTLSTVLRCLWDSGNAEPLTKTSRISVTGGHVGVVTHITLAELNRVLNETELLNGFANRFLWICARRDTLKAFPEAMPEDKLIRLQERIFSKLSRFQERCEMSLDYPARGLWEKIYPFLSQDRPGLVGTVLNRAEAQVLRLALIYAILDGSMFIGLPHLHAALAFWRYAEASAHFIFGGRETEPRAQKIVDALQNGPLETSGLYAVFSNHISKRELEATLNSLIASGRIEYRDEVKEPGSKPKRTYFLSEFSEFSELASKSDSYGANLERIKCEFSPEEPQEPEQENEEDWYEI